MNIGMVFAVIFTIIVLSFLIIFWSDSITKFICLSSDAQIQKTIDDLKGIVEDLRYTSEGSSRRFELHIPLDTKLCFVNPKDTKRNPTYHWEPDPVFEKMIATNGYNIWYTSCSGSGGEKIKSIKTKYNFCSFSGDTIYFENKGYFIQVSMVYY